MTPATPIGLAPTASLLRPPPTPTPPPTQRAQPSHAGAHLSTMGPYKARASALGEAASRSPCLYPASLPPSPGPSPPTAPLPPFPPSLPGPSSTFENGT